MMPLWSKRETHTTESGRNKEALEVGGAEIGAAARRVDVSSLTSSFEREGKRGSKARWKRGGDGKIGSLKMTGIGGAVRKSERNSLAASPAHSIASLFVT